MGRLVAKKKKSSGEEEMINGARIKKRLEKMESREKDIGISLKIYIFCLK